MLEADQLANQAKLGEFVVNQKSNNVKELALHSNITTKLENMEDITNKVTTLDSSSTDTQYPSAKCVYNLVGDVESLLASL